MDTIVAEENAATSQVPEALRVVPVVASVAAPEIVDLADLFAVTVAGEWRDVVVYGKTRGRVRLRASGFASWAFSSKIEADVRARLGIQPEQPLPKHEQAIINVQTLIEQHIVDFDGFVLNGQLVPNRDGDGKLNVDRLRFLLSMTPIQNEIFELRNKLNADAEQVAEAEAKNSQTPSLTS